MIHEGRPQLQVFIYKGIIIDDQYYNANLASSYRTSLQGASHIDVVLMSP